MAQLDQSDRRQPTVYDPWPGGNTIDKWPCWCAVCQGMNVRTRDVRDRHMRSKGVFTTHGVVPADVFRNLEHAHHVIDPEPALVNEVANEDVEPARVHERANEDAIMAEPNLLPVDGHISDLSGDDIEAREYEEFPLGNDGDVPNDNGAAEEGAEEEEFEEDEDMPNHNGLPNVEAMDEDNENHYAQYGWHCPQNMTIPLYEGSDLSRGKFSLLMSRIATSHKVSKVAMDEFYQLIEKILPRGNTAPKSCFVANKIVASLGLKYIKIEACPNHHILYRKDSQNDYSHITSCPTCGQSRYEPNSLRPRKVVRYFPIIPRMQLSFQNPKLAKLLRWHEENQQEDRLCGPIEGKAWSHIKEKYPAKFSDPRSLRLGLAMDGVSPFSNTSNATPQALWPILMNVFNFPPSLTTKPGYAWLVMLLPGRTQVPHQYLDIYLQPLYEELIALWNGVPALDGSLPATDNQAFRLHAILMFTMHDWPGASYCSGLSTSGLHGCPMCHDDVSSVHDRELGKILYGRHRRFLPQGDSMRTHTDHWFGDVELDGPPRWPDGDDWLNRWEEVLAGQIPIRQSGMRRLAIWWKLPYWKDLLVRHTMDPMHIEANVARNLLDTLLGINKKDSSAIRANCQAYNMHPAAWAIPGTSELPPAPWILTSDERRLFMDRLASIRFPTGYGAGFVYSFAGDYPKGLKSHDLHCLMQHGFAYAIQGLASAPVRAAIYQLSAAFRQVCSKEILFADLDKMEEDMARAVCMFEKCFPPSFFVSQVHLLIHLVEEIRLCGPFPPPGGCILGNVIWVF